MSMQPPTSTSSTRKRRSTSTKDHEAKKICVQNNNTKLSIDTHWTDDYTEGDSIFFEITAEELNNFNDLESKDHRNDDEYGIQCSQKFIDDISRIRNNDLNCSTYIHGSQYHTRDEIRNQTILNRSHIASINTDIHDIKNELWDTSESFTASVENNFPLKGPFYGLPEKVEKLIFKYKGIKDLYEWQKECLSLPAIENRKNLLYALPTSGGKTLVAEILMLREIICREKNIIFILPYVSIVQEKVSSMTPFAVNFDFIVEEYAGGKGRCPPAKSRKRNSIYIASIEKAAVLFDSLIEAQRANEIGLIVVDELHLIGEKGRGAVLESLLTKVMFIQAGIQIVGMSATIGNISELSEFLDADVYTRGFRPVELKEFIKCGKDIVEVNTIENSINEFLTHRRVDYKYTDNATKIDPDHIAGLVSEIIPNESCLIFCPTRKNCENVAMLLSKVFPRGKYTEHRKNEKMQLMDALEKLCGTLSPVLEQTIPFGIAYHHSGLTTDEKKLLESAYRFGTLSVICCTSTLAAGVNLPAKRVIIRAPYIGTQFITLAQYKQMVGRAGRAGLGNDAGESILICSAKDNYQIGQMLLSPMDKVLSSLDYQNAVGLQSLVMSAIGLNIAGCLRDLLKLVSQTLLSVQAEELGVSINALVTSIIRSMFKHKILKVPNMKAKHINDIMTTQEIRDNQIPEQDCGKLKYLILSKSTKIELTTIGKASFKAGIDYKKAQYMYDEIKTAQKSFVLSNYSHLLYLVVTFNSNNDSIIPNPTILFREYNCIDDDTRLVAATVGITEANMMKIGRTLSLKGSVESQLNRLYKVMILNDIIKLTQLHEIATKYGLYRGIVQNFVTQSISSANSIIRLCEQIEEFWCFRGLFERLAYKLDHCCIPELAPLLDLPSVKIYRARQLYNAGFKTIEDIAKTTSKTLVRSIEHMTHRTAKQIISAAKMTLIKKLEDLQEETQTIMSCLQMA